MLKNNKNTHYSSTTKSSAFDRVKTWRHPFISKTVQDTHIITKKPKSAQQRYHQICDMLMFNYFDQSAVGKYIQKKNTRKNQQFGRSSKNIEQIIEHPIVENTQKAQEVKREDFPPRDDENIQINKLEKMAFNMNNFTESPDNNIDQSHQEKIEIKGKILKQIFSDSSNIERAKSCYKLQRIKNNKKVGKVSELKRQILQLQKQATTNFGIKFRLLNDKGTLKNKIEGHNQQSDDEQDAYPSEHHPSHSRAPFSKQNNTNIRTNKHIKVYHTKHNIQFENKLKQHQKSHNEANRILFKKLVQSGHKKHVTNTNIENSAYNDQLIKYQYIYNTDEDNNCSIPLDFMEVINDHKKQNNKRKLYRNTSHKINQQNLRKNMTNLYMRV